MTLNPLPVPTQIAPEASSATERTRLPDKPSSWVNLRKPPSLNWLKPSSVPIQRLPSRPSHTVQVLSSDKPSLAASSEMTLGRQQYKPLDSVPIQRLPSLSSVRQSTNSCGT